MSEPEANEGRARMPARLRVGVALFVLLAAFWTFIAVQAFRSGHERAQPWNGVLAAAILLVAATLILFRQPLGRQLAILLAWTWGLWAGLSAFFAPAWDMRALAWGMAALGPLVALAFTGKATGEWLGLRCMCGSRRVRSRDLFFRRVRCTKCGREWRRLGRVDASVFD